MIPERPDLSDVDDDVLAYITALEDALAVRKAAGAEIGSRDEPPLEPSEPPTPINLITVSAAGLAKRTPRHLYDRQRRAGMGIFDLESPEEDPPTFLLLAHEQEHLVVLTDQGRAFRMAVQDLPETPVRGRGQPLAQRLQLRPDERLAVLFAGQGGSHLVVVTERGQVRRFSAHLVGDQLRSGTILYDVREGGPPAGVCWVEGTGDLFIATRQGKAIRFSERQVPVRGCLGIRLDQGDTVVSVAAVTEESGVFLLGADGKGSTRLMTGFSANKSPGTGGKVAFKTDQLVGAAAVSDADDIIVISRLSKVIRFRAVEVPAKEGVVQGVNCMSLRADECRVLVVSPG